MAKLVVKTVQARDLKSADSNGLSDPYVIVRFNDKKAKSKVVKRSLNPLWSEQFVFDAPGGAPSGKVSFTVMDWDRVGSDDFLGEFSIALGDGGVEAGKPKEAWYKLDGPPAEKVTGEVHAIVQWVAAGHGGDVPTLQPKLVAEGSGQLFVGVIEARNVAAKDASGTSDPLCKVHFNGQRYKTKQVMKTLSPVWHDEFYFEVPKAALGGAVLVEMFDWNLLGANDPMGAVSVPLGDMPDGGELDRWLPLVPQKKEKVAGELRLRLAYLSAAKAQMNARIADENYDALLRIVLAQDVVLISVLCDVYQSNEVAHVVVSIFEANNQAHRVLNQLLFREIKRTEQETTLFRTDSMATKSTRNYMKLIATTYLRDTLGPLIAEVLAAPAGSFEVDPSKVDAAAGGGGGGAAGAHNDSKSIERLFGGDDSALVAGDVNHGVTVVRKYGLLVMLAEYLKGRTATVNNYCVVCDRPHVFANGNMLKPSVCSRELCCWSFQQLGVGSESADDIATSAELVDLLVTFAVAAAKSSRAATIFEPYPNVFDPANPKRHLFDPANKDFAHLRTVLEKMPSVERMTQAADFGDMKSRMEKAHPHAYPLMQWIIQSNRAHIVKLDKDRLCKSMVTTHQYLMLSASPEKEARFQQLKKKHKSCFAFHGSSVENWHSILRGGLRNASGTKLQVNGAAHGKGIYLSPQASVSFGYSRMNYGGSAPNARNYGAGGNRFLQSDNVGCICIVEVIDHDIKKSGNIWVQPHEDHVVTRMFFCYPSSQIGSANQQYTNGQGALLGEIQAACKHYNL
eukprot:CAMPEP_0198308766 /NCGR_PEP_ID=MMETSP1450-20131203/1338_1 /TAXON_ID=753684 ORGANISM="Madagascaria erythrocladiodes, Strain CCMP3234" /NCGR_SAMPLE_ID=MMETSP1450 /ASSEMBLY_ACC=CAM_ASM_001115 /LENGTH=793 /DNA_ID=CAMNT_0044011471 /DNA_START=83 /DNA_END=2464 /DNA_ORIENTATION=-